MVFLHRNLSKLAEISSGLKLMNHILHHGPIVHVYLMNSSIATN